MKKLFTILYGLSSVSLVQPMAKSETEKPALPAEIDRDDQEGNYKITHDGKVWLNSTIQNKNFNDWGIQTEGENLAKNNKINTKQNIDFYVSAHEIDSSIDKENKINPLQSKLKIYFGMEDQSSTCVNYICTDRTKQNNTSKQRAFYTQGVKTFAIEVPKNTTKKSFTYEYKHNNIYTMQNYYMKYNIDVIKSEDPKFLFRIRGTYTLEVYVESDYMETFKSKNRIKAEFGKNIYGGLTMSRYEIEGKRLHSDELINKIDDHKYVKTNASTKIVRGKTAYKTDLEDQIKEQYDTTDYKLTTSYAKMNNPDVTIDINSDKENDSVGTEKVPFKIFKKGNEYYDEYKYNIFEGKDFLETKNRFLEVKMTEDFNLKNMYPPILGGRHPSTQGMEKDVVTFYKEYYGVDVQAEYVAKDVDKEFIDKNFKVPTYSFPVDFNLTYMNPLTGDVEVVKHNINFVFQDFIGRNRFDNDLDKDMSKIKFKNTKELGEINKLEIFDGPDFEIDRSDKEFIMSNSNINVKVNEIETMDIYNFDETTINNIEYDKKLFELHNLGKGKYGIKGLKAGDGTLKYYNDISSKIVTIKVHVLPWEYKGLKLSSDDIVLDKNRNIRVRIKYTNISDVNIPKSDQYNYRIDGKYVYFHFKQNGNQEINIHDNKYNVTRTLRVYSNAGEVPLQFGLALDGLEFEDNNAKIKINNYAQYPNLRIKNLNPNIALISLDNDEINIEAKQNGEVMFEVYDGSVKQSKIYKLNITDYKKAEVIVDEGEEKNDEENNGNGEKEPPKEMQTNEPEKTQTKKDDVRWIVTGSVLAGTTVTSLITALIFKKRKPVKTQTE